MRRALLILLLLAVPGAGRAADRLPGLGAELAGTTVSGLSSGAYMAVQFHLAHATIVRGVGVVAGGLWGCAQGSASRAVGECMKGTPDVAARVAEARRAAGAGRIDPVDALAGDRVWLFSGYNDGVVRQSAVAVLREFYRQLAPEAERFFRHDLPAGHAMVTEQAGGACEVTGGSFLADCDYDAAGSMLQFLLGALAPPEASGRGRLARFDQTEFAGGRPRRIALADEGFVYVPASCADGVRCRVHVALHGCNQSAEKVGEAFVRDAGYNRWAESNRIVVLYPQARSTWGAPWNPYGCWDWWGYTGTAYTTRAAPQIAAIRAMVDRLASGRSRAPADGRLAPAVLDVAPDGAAFGWRGGRGTVTVRAVEASGQSIEKRMPARAGSVAIEGLMPQRTYAVRVSGAGEADSSPAAEFTLRTPAWPPPCDPWFGTNVDHVSAGRAHLLWGRTYAQGTAEDLGWWNVFTTHTLHHTPAGFSTAPCPARSGN